MKVLTFVTGLSIKSGGPSRSVPMLVRGLAEEGVDITLMTVFSPDMNSHALEGSTAKLKVLPRDYTNEYLEKYIVTETFDLIQAQSMWDLRYHNLKKIADKHNIPYIITPRGMLEPWSLSQNRWKKRIALWLYQLRDLKKSACIYTTARMEAKHVRDLGVHVPMSIIPNGIETEGYACRKDINVIKKQVLFLSRIHVKKGIELLIEAWKCLLEEETVKDWQLLIVGNGESDYVNSLKQKVDRLNLHDCVKILPPVFGDEKVRLYQESSLFCLPSYSENFGMVIAEAMSCGVPVITTQNCPWQILNESKTGWCIDLSVENLVQTLREAITMEPQVLYEKGQKGSQLVFEKYNYHSVAKKTKMLYEWIINGGEKPEFIYD